MTTNKQKATAGNQPRAVGETGPAGMILRPLDVDGVVALLESWENDPDETEQRETLEYLRRTLDEDRLSDRKLFR